MEAKFKSLSVFEFQQLFPDDESCLLHLAELKWDGDYKCPKCGHTHYCKGVKELDRQCTRCRYNESPTAGTLFHKIKFSLRKAFWIVYFVSTNKKGISSTELSRKLRLRQKTAWLFKRKVMRAMRSSGEFPLSGRVVVDECVVGNYHQLVSGKKIKSKKQVVFAIEERGKGVSRLYGRVIQGSSAKNLGGFMNKVIDQDAVVRSDGRAAYTALKEDFGNLVQVKYNKRGKSFLLMHRVKMGFKGWLRGMHHHAEHLQAYIDEYTYRFNRSFMKEDIFENLLHRMVDHPPAPYKILIAKAPNLSF